MRLLENSASQPSLKEMPQSTRNSQVAINKVPSKQKRLSSLLNREVASSDAENVPLKIEGQGTKHQSRKAAAAKNANRAVSEIQAPL